MRRELPPRPHIDHLKKQAKDLLDGHARRDPEALSRIVDALPAFAGYSAEHAANAPFALHDAQSAIAREYGFASWRELREEVARRATETAMRANANALIDAAKQRFAFPDAAVAAMRAAREDREPVNAALQRPLPDRLPLLAVRDTVLLPGSIAPLFIARLPSRAAIDLAERADPSTVALFAQTSPEEQIHEDGLHRQGCEALLRSRLDTEDGKTFAVLEMLRPIQLSALESAGAPDAALWARIEPFSTDVTDSAGEIVGLTRNLREEAGRLAAAALPEPAAAIAALAALGPAKLADAVVQNLGCSVADKARFAAEPKLVERLRIALALTRAQAQATG